MHDVNIVISTVHAYCTHTAWLF